VKKAFEENLRELIPKRYPYYVQMLPGWLEDDVRVCVISNYFRRIDSRIERRKILYEFARKHLPPETCAHLSIMGGYPIEEAVYYPFLDHSQWEVDGQPEKNASPKTAKV
jgi:hypothetical protein